MNLKQRILYRKILVGAIATILILLLIFPFSAYWSVDSETDPGSWKVSYVLTEIELITGLAPFYVLFATYLVLQNRIVRIGLRILLVALAGFYFYFCMLSRLPMPDYAPALGTLLLFPLLPLLILLFYQESWIRYLRNNGQ